jgi:hypothetical protein
MMSKRIFLNVIMLFLVIAAGCSKTRQDDQAIRAAVQKHLSERGDLNMAGMDVDVKQVKVDGNRAEAQVEFRVKQGGASMQMAYTLERQGEAWVVRSATPAGGGMAHPPTGAGTPPSGAGDLPAGHPPTTGQAPAPPAKKP